MSIDLCFSTVVHFCSLLKAYYKGVEFGKEAESNTNRSIEAGVIILSLESKACGNYDHTLLQDGTEFS